MVNNRCNQLSELLDAYHDGELAAAEHEAVESHVGECTACSNRLAEIDRIVRDLKSLPKLRPSRDFVDSIDFDKLISELDAQQAPALNMSVVPPVSAVHAAETVSVNPQQKAARNNVAPMKKRLMAGTIAGAAAAVALVFATTLPHKAPPENLANKPVGDRATVVADNSASSTAPAVVRPVLTNSPANSVNRASDNNTQAQLSKTGSAAKPANTRTLDRTASPDVPSRNKALIAEAIDNSADPDRTMNDPIVQPTGDVKSAAVEIAVLAEDESGYDSFGFATDEDGLYDIKI